MKCHKKSHRSAGDTVDVVNVVSPAEQCDLVRVKVHELFQVCGICGKGVVFFNMAQYGLLYTKVSVIKAESSIYIHLLK